MNLMPEVPTERPLGRLVNLSVDQLQPHPSLIRLNIVPSAQELSATRERNHAIREPLTITQEGYILAGHARWNLARRQKELTLPCLQVEITEEESILWLIQRNQRSNIINDFSRILLALELEPCFKSRARSNRQVGGRLKGSSNLTEADKLDVRAEIATVAGVSVGNVTKVKILLREASPEVLQALRSGETSIHRAFGWLSTPEKQLDHLKLYQTLRGITNKVDSLLRAHRGPNKAKNGQPDIQRIGSALAALGGEQKNSVLVAEIHVPGEILLLSSRLLQSLESQREIRCEAHGTAIKENP